MFTILLSFLVTNYNALICIFCIAFTGIWPCVIVEINNPISPVFQKAKTSQNCPGLKSSSLSNCTIQLLILFKSRRPRVLWVLLTPTHLGNFFRP